AEAALDRSACAGGEVRVEVVLTDEYGRQGVQHAGGRGAHAQVARGVEAGADVEPRRLAEFPSDAGRRLEAAGPERVPGEEVERGRSGGRVAHAGTGVDALRAVVAQERRCVGKVEA